MKPKPLLLCIFAIATLSTQQSLADVIRSKPLPATTPSKKLSLSDFKISGDNLKTFYDYERERPKLSRAKILLKRGNFKGAIAIFKSELETIPKHEYACPILINLGTAYALNGNLQKASESYTQATIAIDPNFQPNRASEIIAEYAKSENCWGADRQYARLRCLRDLSFNKVIVMRAMNPRVGKMTDEENVSKFENTIVQLKAILEPPERRTEPKPFTPNLTYQQLKAELIRDGWKLAGDPPQIPDKSHRGDVRGTWVSAEDPVGFCKDFVNHYRDFLHVKSSTDLIGPVWKNQSNAYGRESRFSFCFDQSYKGIPVGQRMYVACRRRDNVEYLMESVFNNFVDPSVLDKLNVQPSITWEKAIDVAGARFLVRPSYGMMCSLPENYTAKTLRPLLDALKKEKPNLEIYRVDANSPYRVVYMVSLPSGRFAVDAHNAEVISPR